MGQESIANSNEADSLIDGTFYQLFEEDLHQYVKKSGWPLDDYFPEPDLIEISDRKNINKKIAFYLSEHIRLSLERHFEAIGISRQLKQAWFKQAILRLLAHEQMFQKNDKSLSNNQLLHPSLVKADKKINYNTHIAIYLNEHIQLTLEDHLKAKDISRRQWIEKAILRLLQQEQEYFFNKRNQQSASNPSK